MLYARMLYARCDRETSTKDLSQFQWKSAHAPKEKLPKDFLQPNHIMSLFNPILDIPKRSFFFNFQWKGRYFIKLIKSSVKTEGCIVSNLSNHYSIRPWRLNDPHKTLWKGYGHINRVIHVLKSCFVSHENGVNQRCADVLLLENNVFLGSYL